jgi:hypothetical protein
VLTARDVAFLVDDSGSGLREVGRVECEKTVKADDPALLNSCITSAREKFQPDVLRFESDEKGNVVLSIYKRTGTALKEVYVASVVFSEETPEAVKLTVRGREQGQRPLFKAGTSLVSVPNEYSLELEDMKYGRLVYNAKIGLVGKR